MELQKINPHLVTRRGIPMIDPALILEPKDLIKFTLFIINAGIFSVAGGAGYFFTGSTLRPIREMVDDQNRFVTDASRELRTPLAPLKFEIVVALREKKMTAAETQMPLTSNLE